MPARRRVAVLVLGAALATAPAAFAQSDDGQLSPTPPNSLENGSSNGSSSSEPPASAPLPDTGADVPAMAFLGLGLLVSGIGLRLRTVDDRVF